MRLHGMFISPARFLVKSSRSEAFAFHQPPQIRVNRRLRGKLPRRAHPSLRILTAYTTPILSVPSCPLVPFWLSCINLSLLFALPNPSIPFS